MSTEDDRERLLDLDLVRRRFLRVAFAASHGAGDDDLGAGLLYYSFTRLARAQVAVCIGSGGGFVPALMAQAQCELELTPCATYLVDAVLPELDFGSPLQSGGWLAPGNDLLDRYPQMRVLRLMSVDAARLFGRHGVEIDILHIDGDHSKSGVQVDLEAFAPLLSPGAIVTLHDASHRPVRAAVDDFLVAHPDFEHLSFAELGAGTLVLRAGQAPGAPAPRSDRTVDLEAADCRDAEAAGAERIRFERWRYLATEAYRTRYKLAADWIDAADATVVEIGGYPNSVVPHLRRARRVVAVEPYAPAGYVDEVEAAAAQRGIEVLVLNSGLAGALPRLARVAPFNLIALGLDLSGGAQTADEFAADVAALYQGLVAAERVALGWPEAVRTGQLWARLRQWLDARVHQHLRLDLSQDPVGEEFHVRDARAQRNLVLAAPGQARSADQVADEVRTLAAELYAEIRPEVEEVEPVLPLGATIRFVTGEDCRRYLGFGWSRQEPAFTHGLGDESDVVFELSAADRERVAAAEQVRVAVTLWPVVAKDGEDTRRVEVWLDEVQLFAGSLGAQETLAATVPVATLREPGRHTLRFLHRDRVRPCDLNPRSTDTRPLSVALVDLCVDVVPAG